ncbi:D-alanyl-D-alanine carboxypeptidase family protein [Sulfitobacter geojensis]|uniref:serine-type D-Ala-D-Ala carboxypeptidase n=1 Tax=Sulfitobacter geojensis TaxID=1342299 RepID=A0AAE2VWN8_9RHOB|nr:D-alanyl-D-alanine carboxypeptidase family protein [Sulfitobacter geojensis]MBM1688806.1 D-alanyl-D-alanine carboxypeptidase [Sulfitobacter geojensis]MBM1692873.1 D-alanyl-D-alanine carboxypeptidase [Sulfitobacter geojensis]MBM1705039.1 D-alanyl-D-alanine carboxypeptidase [Sulfitobacter geojensis]MBM1709097.1 D-alanyl-D-alanine carboxypeptidase [Sulfitobacter geojensis]MBM1713162.1 D-alanyl-D-alanine carboxypeptidase [Sulfitobacter geojensis]
MLCNLTARILATSLTLALSTSAAFAFETKATAAYVIDQTTGTVLLAKDADTPLPPASMSKLMTLYMAFEAVASGRLELDQKLPVSADAAAYSGSTMFLQEGERVSVEDLLRGIIVLSGNDACVVIAEALSGTESRFARDMTMRAQQLGMTNSTFMNSNGWPKPGHRMSMRDLGLLANRLISDYPQFYPMFAEREFMFDANESANRFNRNPLLQLDIGADGLKTGHTSEAGYGLVGSAKQGDRRVIFVISGLDSAAGRARESESIVNWAFRQFSQQTLGTAGTQLAEAPVAMGDQPTVGLELAEDLSVLTPISASGGLNGEVVFTGPFRAPILKGDAIAELILTREDLPDVTVPLVAAQTVQPGGFMVKMTAAAKHLLARLNAGPQDAS